MRIRAVDYFNVTVSDQTGEAHRLLSHFAAEGVNFLAFHAIPLGPVQTQFVLFPDDSEAFQRAADNAGLHLSGCQRALLVQGDDRLGALADIHRQLLDARVDVYGSNGVTDGRGGFGYVLYVKPGDFDSAAAALGL